jgi:hypothetical protein
MSLSRSISFGYFGTQFILCHLKSTKNLLESKIYDINRLKTKTKWKYFSTQCSPIYETAFLRGGFSGFMRLPFL